MERRNRGKPDPRSQPNTKPNTDPRAENRAADRAASTERRNRTPASTTDPSPSQKRGQPGTGKPKPSNQPPRSQPSPSGAVRGRRDKDLANEVKKQGEQTREYVRDSVGRFTSEAQPASGSTATATAVLDFEGLNQTLQQIDKRLERIEKRPTPKPAQKSGKAKKRHSETTKLLKTLNLNTVWLAFQQDVSLMIGAATAILLLLGAELLLTPQQSIITQGIQQALGTDFDKPVKEGETIGGYPVTSGFGPREAPTEGASSDHKGVDLGTPTGTKLYMIGDEGGTVECKEQPEGAGTYAVIKPKGVEFEFYAMHLNKCQAGDWAMGNVFAETGNSGNSTGPHLHWGQMKDGEYIQPVKGWLIWVVTGSKPSAPGAGDFELQAGDFGGTSLSQEQLGNAAAIISKGTEMGMSQNDIKIALMTVMVESTMKNLDYGDLDSLGLFQQRDSWGSDECRTDPACSSELFFKALQQVSDRDSKAPGDVAQAVQKSAFPDRYAKQEGVADAIVSQVFAGGGASTGAVEVASRSIMPGGTSQVTQAVQPVQAAIGGSPLLQLKARLNAVINGGGVTASSAGTAVTGGAVATNLSEAVFRIGSATGWMGADGYGYTATHVTDITKDAKTQSGESCQISVDKQVQDVTRLKVEGPCASLPGVPLGTHEDGEVMKAYGFPKGGELYEAVGASGGMNQDMSGQNSIEFMPDPLPGLQAGMSGGLCAGSDGAAIGVVSNGTNPEGQYNQGDKAWCAPLNLLTNGN